MIFALSKDSSCMKKNEIRKTKKAMPLAMKNLKKNYIKP